MRQLLRAKARFGMKKAGLTHVNRKESDKRSFFAKHWREFC